LERRGEALVYSDGKGAGRRPAVRNARQKTRGLGNGDALDAGEHFIEGFGVAAIVKEKNQFEVLDVNAL
jgi:hypothetical protein